MAAEAEAIADGVGDGGFAGDVGDDVEVALGVLFLDVDGGRDDAVADGHDAGNEFDATCGTEHVTGHGFGGADGEAVLGVVAEGKFDGFGFGDVAKAGGGGVGVEVLDFLGVGFTVAEGHLDGVGGAGAVGRGGGEVIGIRADAVAGELGVDFRAAFAGVFEFFDDDDSCAFAHDEAVAVFVEGAGCVFGVVVSAGGKGLHVGEAGEAHGEDGGFGTAAEEGVGVAEFDHAPGFTDVVVGGGAGGDDDHVWAKEAEFHRDDAAGDV